MAKSSHHPERRTAKDVVPADVLVQPIRGTTKTEAVTELLNALVIDGVLDLSREQSVREAILEREKVASTGIGNGVAIPHAKNKYAERFGWVLGTSREGVEFDAHDQMPAFVVALWVCRPKDTKEHLALMRALAYIAKDPKLSSQLGACKDKRGVHAVLEQVPLDSSTESGQKRR